MSISTLTNSGLHDNSSINFVNLDRSFTSNINIQVSSTIDPEINQESDSVDIKIEGASKQQQKGERIESGSVFGSLCSNTNCLPCISKKPSSV